MALPSKVRILLPPFSSYSWRKRLCGGIIWVARRHTQKGVPLMESSASTSRVLVVAHKTAATQPLLNAVRERAQRGPCVFTLLVPNATHGLHKVVDPEDQAAGEARTVLDRALP